jgi:hypothetical protein
MLRLAPLADRPHGEHHSAVNSSKDDALKTAVEEVLERAARGKSKRPQFVTAYQILQRIPEDLRAALIAQYAEPGRGAGKPFSAASRVGQLAAELGAEHEYLDARGMSFAGDEEQIIAGYPVVSIYRAPPVGASWEEP